MSAVIERVLVALDATAENRIAIDTAVQLAAHAKKPLHAVFVEDVELLSLVALSVARQFVPGAGGARLTLEEVELQLRAAADRAREDLFEAARGHALECSFEVVRSASETALVIASDRDLVVAGALARPVAGRFRIDSRWLAALQLAPAPVLLARERRDPSRGVAALLRERSPGSGRLLQSAARIAEFGSRPLTVICPPALAAAGDFARWVDEQIKPSIVRPRIEAAPGERAALYARIAELDCGLLAIGTGAAEGGSERLRELTDRLSCDVLFVR